jgi:hypothetical protein
MFKWLGESTRHESSLFAWFSRAAAACVAVLALGAADVGAQQPLRLWTLEEPCPADAETSDPKPLDCRVVVVDRSALTTTPGDRIQLTLLNGEKLEAVNVRHALIGKNGEDGIVWDGKIRGDPLSTVTFTAFKSAVVGGIVLSGGRFLNLRVTPAGKQVIEAWDSRSLPRTESVESAPPGASCGPDPEEPVCETDEGKVVDVLVVYTSKALAAAGGEDALFAHLHLAIWNANWSYIDSGIDLQLELLGPKLVSSYTQDNVMLDTSLERLWRKADGFLDEIHGWRNDENADVVVLVVERPGGGGRSLQMRQAHWNDPKLATCAFAVVPRQILAINPPSYAIAHELGHVMGAHHDAPDGHSATTDAGAFVYSNGHLQESGSACSPWMTIMSLNNGCSSCVPARIWSGPPDYCGVPRGNSATQDNSHTLSQTASVVAKYRCRSSYRPQNVWIKDAWLDTGREPDPALAGQPMWKSPYIWVRNALDIDLVHQHEHENPEFGQFNYIYVKLNNTGNDSSGTLKIYVADGSTDLEWDIRWNLVQAVPVTTFPRGTTMILEVAWLPPDTGHYCLLARWESPSDPMTFPETASISDNVRQNNNIAWHNVNIVDLVAAESASASFIVRNSEATAKEIALKLVPGDPLRADPFFELGEVYVSLDEKLLEAWESGGHRGEGFTVDGKQLRISNPQGATFGPIILKSKFEGRVTLTFSKPRKSPHRNFNVDVIKLDTVEGQPKQVGGITYDIRVLR